MKSFLKILFFIFTIFITAVGEAKSSPLCEMDYDTSPYAFCGNNPLRFIDPTGMYFDDYHVNRERGIQLIVQTDFSDRIIVDEYLDECVVVTGKMPASRKQNRDNSDDWYYNWYNNYYQGTYPEITTHNFLDIIGFVPGFGEIADGANALLYLSEKDYANESLSWAAMVLRVEFSGQF